MTEEISPIWEATVDDGKFRLVALATPDRHGVVTVTEVASGEVWAIFGPDVADVSQWWAATITVIDLVVKWLRDQSMDSGDSWDVFIRRLADDAERGEA